MIILTHHSPEVDKICPALAKAQGAYPAIFCNAQGATGDVGQGKGRTYQYADLANVLNSVRPINAANGLFLTDALIPATAKRGSIFEVRLWHESGQWISSSMELSLAHLKIQDAGKTLTYFRRYLTSGLLGIASEQDTDGQLDPDPRQRDDRRGRDRDRYPRRDRDRRGYSFERDHGRSQGDVPPPQQDEPAVDAARQSNPDDQPDNFNDWITETLARENDDFFNEQRIANVARELRIPQLMNKFAIINFLITTAITRGTIKPERVAKDGDPETRDGGKAWKVANELFAKYPGRVKQLILEHYAQKRAEKAAELRMEPRDKVPAQILDANGQATHN